MFTGGKSLYHEETETDGYVKKIPSILLDSWELRKFVPEGSVLPNSLICTDVDRDGVEEVLLGTTEGDFLVLKPDSRLPLFSYSLAATISVVLYSEEKHRLVLVTLEGQCEVFENFLDTAQMEEWLPRSEGRSAVTTPSSTGREAEKGFPAVSTHEVPVFNVRRSNVYSCGPSRVFHVPCNCLCGSISCGSTGENDLIFLGSNDRRIYVYDLSTGACLLSLFAHYPVTSVKCFTLPCGTPRSSDPCAASLVFIATSRSIFLLPASLRHIQRYQTVQKESKHPLVLFATNRGVNPLETEVSDWERAGGEEEEETQRGKKPVNAVVHPYWFIQVGAGALWAPDGRCLEEEGWDVTASAMAQEEERALLSIEVDVAVAPSQFVLSVACEDGRAFLVEFLLHHAHTRAVEVQREVAPPSIVPEKGSLVELHSFQSGERHVCSFTADLIEAAGRSTLRASCVYAGVLSEVPLVQRACGFRVGEGEFLSVFLSSNGVSYTVDASSGGVVKSVMQPDCSSFALTAGTRPDGGSVTCVCVGIDELSVYSVGETHTAITRQKIVAEKRNDPNDGSHSLTSRESDDPAHPSEGNEETQLLLRLGRLVQEVDGHEGAPWSDAYCIHLARNILLKGYTNEEWELLSKLEV
ncbi:hypothetical protein AGDE_13636 [Angomonas deanei]|uniref:Uncharacterized protein n=1 Tax=Angomonas deanei TaxID=59799 RepID=A0A7G2C704_9TRYP|nr:hypothetical protein AGDE_13636 [Angomonas deanei]CAD2215255.1 hypothetical protein, conserved [Angomonas deanei]|eukprot:EPY22036.1 hypothetical protein AGDE_13636 [Angomonas deanei]